MSWKFWKREEAPQRQVDPDAEYADAVAAVRSAGHDAPASALNRAGSLAAARGEKVAALAYHGRAVNGYLEGGQYDAAGAVCRVMLRYAPEVVRARCTLALLAVGKRLTADAIEELGGYIEAVRRSRTQSFAVIRLQLMADVTDDAAVRVLLAEALQEFGAPAAAVEAARSGPARARDDEARWRRILQVVAMGPAELWREQWMDNPVA